MRRLVILLSLCATLTAQTTLRLRYGGNTSMYRITAMSTATPSVVTVADYTGAAHHTLTDGQAVYIHEVAGCHSANGYRWIGAATANQSAGTFTLYSDSGLTSPVVCSGTSAFDYSLQSGYVGKVQNYTLQPGTGPRLMIPQSGPVHDRIVDTSGSGGMVGLAETNGNPAYTGLTSRITNNYAATCNAAPSLANCFYITSSQSGGQAMVEGQTLEQAAVLWSIDHIANAADLTYAKYLINHVEYMFEDANNNARPGFATDPSATWGGLNSGTDWLSGYLPYIVRAYDLIKGQMTSDERATFRAKMLNGYDGAYGSCTNQMASSPTGTVNTTAGSSAITGSGFSVYNPGDWIYIKGTKTYGSNGQWYILAGITDDSHATLDSHSGLTTVTGGDHYRVTAWQTGNCGALHAAYSHPYAYHPYSRWWTKLASSVALGDSTITVTSMADLIDPAPFYISVESEVMLVTSIAGNVLSVNRGQLYTSAATHASAKSVVYARAGLAGQSVTSYNWTGGPFAIAGDWRQNLLGQKLVGSLMVSLALADEDSRALDLAERSWNYYYDLTYVYATDMWSGTSQGGYQFGYRWGRWQDLHLNVGAAAEYAFTVPNSIFGPYYWRTLISPWMDTVPYIWTISLWDGIQLTKSNGNIGPSSTEYIAAAQTFNAGQTLTQEANYWFKNLANFWTATPYSGTSSGATAAFFVLAYMDGTETALDPRTTSNPWKFYTDNDFDYLGNSAHTNTYNGLFVSKSDWTPNASMVFSSLGYSDINDHNAGAAPQYAGDYNIIKGVKTLIGANGNTGLEIAGSWSNANGLNFGGMRASTAVPTWATGTYSGAGGMNNTIDRRHADANYVYAMGNFVNSYLNTVPVSISQRSFLHIKGAHEYVLVWDENSAPTTRPTATYIHYFRADEPTVTPTVAGNLATFIKPKLTGATGEAISPSMVLTSWLFPDGQTPSVTTPTCSTSACPVYVNWGTVASAQMLTIHRVSQSTTDAMPTLVAQNPSSFWAGVEIQDPSYPIVTLFSRGGAVLSSVPSFTTTHLGVATYIVAGLQGGATYDVYSGATKIQSAVSVPAGDTTLSFADSAGNHTIVQAGISPPIVTLVSGSPLVGVAMTFQASLGTAPYTWSLPTNTASCSPTTGTGTNFSITCSATGSVTVQVTDSTTANDSLPETITSPLIIAPSVVSARPLTSVTFTASGGVPPYSWSAPGAVVISGTGATFTTDWTTTGPYTVTLMDSAAGTVPAMVTVSQPPSAALAGKAQLAGLARIQ